MARGDRRARATGRLGVKRGERYALIPEEILNSSAYAAQPDFAKVVLIALLARYHGRNNGDLSLPFSEGKRLGIPHQWKLYAGLQLLRKGELIVCTRQGLLERGTKLCSLYAITWRGIDAAPEKVFYDAGVSVCPIASNSWAKWIKPTNWLEIVRDVTRANHGRKKNPVSTTVGKGRSTTVGATDADIAQPRWGMETPIIAPPVVDTSKTLGADAETVDALLERKHAKPSSRVRAVNFDKSRRASA